MERWNQEVGPQRPRWNHHGLGDRDRHLHEEDEKEIKETRLSLVISARSFLPPQPPLDRGADAASA
jgi:hypothetical protein